MEPSESSSRIIRPSATPSPVKFPLSCNPLLDVSASLPCRRQGKNALTAQKTGRLGGNQAMRVEDILSGRTLVKVPVTLWSILQRNNGSIDGLGYLYLVI